MGWIVTAYQYSLMFRLLTGINRLLHCEKLSPSLSIHPSFNLHHMNSPFPPPFQPLTGTTGTITSTTTGTADENNTSGTSKSKDSASPSVFIIFTVVAIAIVIILFIHRILRVLLRTTHGSSSFLLSISNTRNTGTSTTQVLSDEEKITLINSLPLFRLSSQLSVLPKSRDCAICCDPFSLDAELRLLPACSHAFHRPCVDPWLKSNPSCPICRSSIARPFPPLLEFSSGSFRLELGSVSKRSEPGNQNDNRIQPADPPSTNLRSEHDNENDNQPQTQTEVQPAKPPSTSIRSYPMDSYNYFVEEEIEIMPNPPPVVIQEEREIDISDLAPPSPPVLPPPPPPKAWLQEYIDKIASSASSSFNSIRFGSQRWSGRWSQPSSQRWSQRWSQRFDSGEGGGAPPPEAWLWDLEAGQNEEAGGVFAFYRWLTGV
ncbi:hypothetical protein LUZ60_014348 [Juncus effusus]|nr:hypothetical protein LUZ60_014348 [Juncus effusus]